MNRICQFWFAVVTRLPEHLDCFVGLRFKIYDTLFNVDYIWSVAHAKCSRWATVFRILNAFPHSATEPIRRYEADGATNLDRQRLNVLQYSVPRQFRKANCIEEVIHFSSVPELQNGNNLVFGVAKALVPLCRFRATTTPDLLNLG